MKVTLQGTEGVYHGEIEETMLEPYGFGKWVSNSGKVFYGEWIYESLMQGLQVYKNKETPVPKGYEIAT